MTLNFVAMAWVALLTSVPIFLMLAYNFITGRMTIPEAFIWFVTFALILLSVGILL